ncbi:MAG: hypothetical protein LAO51_12545 [Acidobacteriia bacterium]|nr:hypothetical protein [Terriglobia bacterium]
MARRRDPAVRSTSLGAALRQLVDAIARKVVDRVQRQIPEREQLRRIERHIARLARRVETGRRPGGARRVGRPRSNRRCNVRGCARPHVAQGLCSKHYQARRRKNLRMAG